MSKKALLALAGLVLCWGVCYPWTTPAKVNPSGYSGPACARNVTPTSEAVQQDGTSKVRVLHNWGVPALGAPYYMNEALSTDGGTHWTSWNTVHYDPNLSQYSPSLVRVGNVLHATWYQVGPMPFLDAQIFYARSTDFGTTWSVNTPWTNQWSAVNPNDEFPHLAVSSNGQQVVIVWRQTSLYPDRGLAVFVTSLDGGVNWSSPAPITTNGDQAYVTNVAYTSYNGGRFIAVYSKVESPIRIYSTKLPYGGTTWTSPIMVDHNPIRYTLDRYFPTVATNNSADVMCVWQYATGQTGAWFGSNRSLNGADTWPASEQDFGISNNPYDLVVSPWQSLTYDASCLSYLCAWTAKPSSAYDIYENEYSLTNFAWDPYDAQITNNLNRMGSHGPRISRYPGSGQSNRYIAFANGNTATNLSIWESESSFIPFGGGGQSNGVVSRGEGEVPMVRAMPNPAKGFVTIRYALGENDATGTLKVYSIIGQLVKAVSLEGGSTRELTWNLKDEEGKPVANGVYLLRLDGSDVHLGERMVVLR